MADGRWRIYVFADKAAPGDSAVLERWSQWAEQFLPSSLFETKVIYQQSYCSFDVSQVPAIFKPKRGKFQLTDVEQVFGTLKGDDIFDKRSISIDGAVVVVRPDQYVGGIFPLNETTQLEGFVSRIFPKLKVTEEAVAEEEKVIAAV